MAKKNCGACGLFIDEQEQDTKGFHLPELCDANNEYDNLVLKGAK